MPTAKKEAQIEELRERAARAASMFFTDYRGLTVGELRTLRNELRKDASTFSVVKNTLFRMAVDEVRRGQLTSVLEGPTAVAFVGSDPVAAAKALTKFAGDFNKLQIKAAIVDGRYLGPADIAALSKIRSRIELLGALVRSLKSPIYRLHGTLNANRSKLVRALRAIHTKNLRNNVVPGS